jgi:hypothetical protein
MARNRRRTEVQTETPTEASDVFDEAIAAATAVQEPEQTNGNGHAPYIANPSSTRREGHAAAVAAKRVEHSKLTIPAGDLTVHLLDMGDNREGLGIRVTMPEGRKLTDEEKEIIRRHVKGEDGQSGFVFDGPAGMWHKPIGKRGESLTDIPASRAVAIRLDAESRVKGLAAELQHHLGQEGHAARVGQERDESAGLGR